MTLHAHSVQGLIFVASLIDYHCVLYEDASVNSMVECVELFVDMIDKGLETVPQQMDIKLPTLKKLEKV